jgi:hypothetical protein
MGKSDAQTREAMGRLALSCSALARAGQVLSTVSDPAKTEEALRQAASILESDARVSRLPQMETAALECQSVLSTVAVPERLGACRKLATKLARLASTLATEVQVQTRKAGKAEAKPAPEVRPGRTKVDLTPIRVAVTAEERSAVTAALEGGKRLAEVGNGTVIDTRMNLMWAAKVNGPVAHSTALNLASHCRLGSYEDWRLPRPEELQHFLTGGGRDLGGGMYRDEGGRMAVALWSSEASRRWLFIREATAVQVRSGAMQAVSVSRTEVHVLLVRSAPGQE